MNVIILVDTYATRYGFINEKFGEIICQCLTKLKPILRFDDKAI